MHDTGVTGKEVFEGENLRLREREQKERQRAILDVYP